MRRIGSAISLIVVAVLAGGMVRPADAQDPNAMIEGARLWSDNCMRCHNARSPTERNDQDWKTIVIHMRARANLTKSEADKIVAYIQQVNLPENAVSTPRNVPSAEAAEKSADPADAGRLQAPPDASGTPVRESEKEGERGSP